MLITQGYILFAGQLKVGIDLAHMRMGENMSTPDHLNLGCVGTTAPGYQGPVPHSWLGNTLEMFRNTFGKHRTKL